MRIDLTKMILRALRIWLIKTEKIATPDGDTEEWFEREYMERTVYDRLHDSRIAYVSPGNLKTMYDMGKPPYQHSITYEGIQATEDAEGATEYLRRYVLALGLNSEELKCLHGEDLPKGKDLRSTLEYEPRYPEPIDETSQMECEAEVYRIFDALHRKIVLQGLQRKVENLEKRRNREPLQMQLPK
jgi:hypothetical protein